MLDRRRLGRQIVIYTRSYGIYLGSALDLEFWSKYNPDGQDAAITFQSVREAKRFVSCWEDKPTGIQYKQVRANIIAKDGSMYASIEACFRAGLPGWDPWLAGIFARDRYITPRRRKRLSNRAFLYSKSDK
jgi:hypothetical protein